MSGASVRILIGTACLAALAACSAPPSGPVATVTVTRPAPGAASTSPAAPVSGTGAPPSHQRSLNGTCASVLTDYDVARALGRRLPGGHAFVVGRPDPGIHRIGYLNCRYGLTGTGSAPKVEVGISLYSDAGHAAARVTATVDDYAGHGASATHVTVAGHPGTLLTGGSGTGYTVPLLVAASGQRTVAVSVDRSVAGRHKLARSATALGAAALRNTGG